MTTGRSTLPPAESSLLEILESRSQIHPDRLIFSFLRDGEIEEESFTYSQLQHRSHAVAAEIQRFSRPGDRVLLLYPPGLDFIAALFGCFQAGVIAVPVPPPRFDLRDFSLQRLGGIARDAQPVLLLTGGALAQAVVESCAKLVEFSACHCIRTDRLDPAAATAFRPQSIGRDTIALLQYTSGSTGEPRGVVITHGNLLANQHVIQLAMHHRTAQRPGTGVCWLPHYHDMGLIGNILQPFYVDSPCYLMSPLILLQRPVRWLEAISRYRAHTSAGPNFAYDLCVQRISAEQKATLDLSSWEVAAIGAEPVSHKTMDRFVEAFDTCRFRREAFYPCYGLAEATLFVTGGDKESAPVVRTFRGCNLATSSDGSATSASCAPAAMNEPLTAPEEMVQTLVGCGHPWTEHEMAIVHPTTLIECPPGAVGEIWFRGPSVAQGYWRQAEETERVFGGVLQGSNAGPFLRTGDLGFVADGELFIAGRIKDLIVIRGHNHYPQDIEDTVAGVDAAVRPNTAAAFSCQGDGEELLIILQEVDRRTRTLDVAKATHAIRRAVSERHQLLVHDVVFLCSGTLPKTTSGKVRRHECRRQYLSGQLQRWKDRSRNPAVDAG